MMDSIIELKNVSGKLYYSAEYIADEDWIYSNWIGFVNVDEVKAGCNAGLKVMQKFKCKNFLNDNRSLNGPWNKANDWIAHDWMPRALNSGLQNFAHVLSPNVFAQVSAKDLESRVESFGFELKIFDNYELAQDWLRSKSKSTVF